MNLSTINQGQDIPQSLAAIRTTRIKIAYDYKTQIIIAKILLSINQSDAIHFDLNVLLTLSESPD